MPAAPEAEEEQGEAEVPGRAEEANTAAPLALPDRARERKLSVSSKCFSDSLIAALSLIWVSLMFIDGWRRGGPPGPGWMGIGLEPEAMEPRMCSVLAGFQNC